MTCPDLVNDDVARFGAEKQCVFRLRAIHRFALVCAFAPQLHTNLSVGYSRHWSFRSRCLRDNLAQPHILPFRTHPKSLSKSLCEPIHVLTILSPTRSPTARYC